MTTRVSTLSDILCEYRSTQHFGCTNGRQLCCSHCGWFRLDWKRPSKQPVVRLWPGQFGQYVLLEQRSTGEIPCALYPWRYMEKMHTKPSCNFLKIPGLFLKHLLQVLRYTPGFREKLESLHNHAISHCFSDSTYLGDENRPYYMLCETLCDLFDSMSRNEGQIWILCSRQRNMNIVFRRCKLSESVEAVFDLDDRCLLKFSWQKWWAISTSSISFFQ